MKSDLSDEIKQYFFLSSDGISTIVWIHPLVAEEIHGEKANRNHSRICHTILNGYWKQHTKI